MKATDMNATPLTPRRRRVRVQPMLSINLRISAGQLEFLDEAAAEDVTTRSELIRTAIMWYLKPQNRRADQNQSQSEEEYVLSTFERRRAIRAMNKAPKDFDMNE